MKKSKVKIIFITAIIIVVAVAGIVLLSGNKNNDTTSVRVTKEEVLNNITKDNFPAETVIEKTVENEVDVKVEKVESDTFTIEVESPNIAEELFEWVDSKSAEELTDEEMESKILELINETDKETKTFELSYSNNEQLNIQYTEESKNAMSCGMIDFYNMCMEKVIEDMKAGEQ